MSKNAINNTKSLTHILEYVTYVLKIFSHPQVDGEELMYKEALTDLVLFCEGKLPNDEHKMKQEGYLQDDS